MRLSIYVLLLCFTALLLLACDEGLSPQPTDVTTPGMAGMLNVVTAWPPADSVRDVRVVAFRNYPPRDILTEVLGGTAVFSDQLVYDLDAQAWRIVGDELRGVFEYVVAAQQFGGNLFQDWRVIGVYTQSGDVNQPSRIDLATGRFVNNIDIRVDFDNLPPQPF